MAKTNSNMLPLGTQAPHFDLEDVITGKRFAFNDSIQSEGTVVMFICNHCPYVRHVSDELTRLALDYMPRGIRFFAINSNDIEQYPDDSPEHMKATALEKHYPFPYLFDETQSVAKAYEAACTPDFYVFDKALSLVYRGQLDESRLGNNIPVTGSSIRHALNCLLDNEPINMEQKPSLGCNIKWKD